MTIEGQPKRSPESQERPLAGKTALITGVSRNIGAEIAIALAKEGINIIGTRVDPKKKNLAEGVKKEILSQGVKAEILQSDITSHEDRKKLKRAVEKSFDGNLDFLILNASGATTEINVTANNALVSMCLSLMRPGSTIILMQSVPGHFAPELEEKGIVSPLYRPIAQTKYAGEQSLRARMKEFEEKGINFRIICPPEVSDTSNVRRYKQVEPGISEQNIKASQEFGLPISVTKKEVGEKVAEALKRKDLPQGYTELFQKNN